MAHIDTEDLTSIAEANRLGISRLAREAEEGHERILLRNNTPVAAVVGMERLNRLQRLEEDAIDATLAAARVLTTSAERFSLDHALACFGYTREQLRDLPD